MMFSATTFERFRAPETMNPTGCRRSIGLESSERLGHRQSRFEAFRHDAIGLKRPRESRHLGAIEASSPTRIRPIRFCYFRDAKTAAPTNKALPVQVRA